MADKLTPEQDETLRAAFDAGLSCRVAASRAGCGVSAAVSRFKLWRTDAAPKDEPIEGERLKIYESGDDRTVSGSSRKKIITLEDAIAYAEVDLATWRVKSWECTAWEVGMKIRGEVDAKGARGPDKFERHGLWRVSIKLERIIRKELTDASESYFARLAAKAPKVVHRSIKPLRSSGGVLADFHIPDLHLGKPRWDGKREDVAEVFESAVERLWDRAKADHIDEIVYVMGSDHFHVDSPKNQTTSGTQLSLDGDYYGMFDLALDLNTRVISRFADACRRVRIVVLPGNHDSTTVYHLGRTMQAYFRHSDRITFDCTKDRRKYVAYGVNLLGYSHGEKSTPKELAMLMPTERPKEWGETSWREVKHGHRHGFGGVEFNGVRVRMSPALCVTDDFHKDAGYVGNTRCAEVHLYHEKEAYITTHNIMVRP